MGILDRGSLFQCRNIEDYKIVSRGPEHVLLPADFERLSSKVKEIDEDVYHAVVILYHTGIRLSELFSLNLTSYRENLDEHFVDTLVGKKNPWETDRKISKVPGLLVLDSQVKSSILKNMRDENGNLNFSSVKTGKGKIDYKDLRLLPIFCKRFYETVVFLHGKAEEDFEKRKFGKNKKNYFYFTELYGGKVRRVMAQAGEAIGLKVIDGSSFTPYCLRHSCCTLLAFFDNESLNRKILGHRSAAVNSRYQHLSKLIIDTKPSSEIKKRKFSSWDA